MAFYGNTTDAETMAGVPTGTVTTAMQNFINQWIDDNIRMDGFTIKTADEYYDIQRTGQNELVLNHFPVVSVTQLVNGAMNTTPVTLILGSDFVVDTEPAIIQLPTLTFDRGINQVRVQYQFGYSTVPDDIKQIATMMAAKWAQMKITQADADGLKQVKIGDYQETRDISFMSIKSEYDDMLRPMVERAKMRYAAGA